MMKNREIVSVFIIGNNNECKLKKAFDSLLKQTNTDFEIIFKDNCSSDSSYECAIEYSSKFKQRNIFMSVSRNRFEMELVDCFNYMTQDSEGLLLYFMNPVVCVGEFFIEHAKKIFRENKINELLMSRDVASVVGKGVVDNTKLWEIIYKKKLYFCEMIFNRNTAVIFDKNNESFIGYQHIYRTFIYSLVGDIFVDDEIGIEMNNEVSKELNMLDEFEKYRLYIAMCRKATVFQKQEYLPNKDYIKNVLIDECKAKIDRCRNGNKEEESRRYEHLKKVFELV